MRPFRVVEEASLVLVCLAAADYPTHVRKNWLRTVDQVMLLEVRSVCEAAPALAAPVRPGARVLALVPV